MKTSRITIQVIMAMALYFGIQGSYAFAPETTHAGLTQEMVAFYEEVFGERLTDEEKELIIQASIDEDIPPTRALNHFYDPIHNRGINEYRTSYRWATDELSGNDFTWSKGIDAYARGDRRSALIALGHVLHLLEDSSVPDHTRNDPHMGHGASGLYTGESPMEDWADHAKTRESLIGLGEKYANTSPWLDRYEIEFLCFDLKECFDRMALYSNQNFYSADTINHPDYNRPIVLSSDERFAYGKDELTDTVEKLYAYKTENGEVEFFLADKENHSVLESYFDRLAPQVIPTGARVIDLFLKQAEAARQIEEKKKANEHEKVASEEVALNERMQNAGILKQFAFGFGELFVKKPASVFVTLKDKTFGAGDKALKGYAILFGEGIDSGKLLVASGERANQLVTKEIGDGAVAAAEKGERFATAVVTGAVDNTQKLEELIRQLVTAKEILESIREKQLASAGMPRGEVLGVSTVSLTTWPVLGGGVWSSDVPPVPPPPVTPPEPTMSDAITTPDREDPADEGGEEDPTEEVSATTTPDVLTPPPPEDTTAPDAPIVTSDVSLPFSSTTVSLLGSAEASSTVSATISGTDPLQIFLADTDQDGAWSFVLVLPEGTSTIMLNATDAVGNVSSTTVVVLSVELPPPPPSSVATIPARAILINEIAWAGTVASAQDEWFELKNLTGDPIDLSPLRLVTADGRISLTLSGVIAPGGYFVVAATPDLFLDVTPNLVLPLGGGLSDTAEMLSLVEVDPEGSEVGVVDLISDCVYWCGVHTFTGESLQRAPWSDGSSTSFDDWMESYPYEDGSKDRDGNFISGTPGRENVPVPLL
jgi:hypothetical protein